MDTMYFSNPKMAEALTGLMNMLKSPSTFASPIPKCFRPVGVWMAVPSAAFLTSCAFCNPRAHTHTKKLKLGFSLADGKKERRARRKSSCCCSLPKLCFGTKGKYNTAISHLYESSIGFLLTTPFWKAFAQVAQKQGTILLSYSLCPAKRSTFLVSIGIIYFNDRELHIVVWNYFLRID